MPARKTLPRRPRRSESFLGIHFDCHMTDRCREVGKTLTRRKIERILEQVKPDYVQVDCKGHPGVSSYPTKVGHAAPKFVRDPLRLWRDATAARGVALFLHYSGVWDAEALKRHPSWARIDERGKRDPKNTSVFGPYADKLLIPQLRELAGVYGADGVWVDGDCWATGLDYGREALRQFRQATGIRSVPRRPEDPHFFEFVEFCREAFRRYLRHYADELHKTHPDFQVCSNWAFSSHMPEPVSAGVDFLSGDYPLQDSVHCARLEARVLARQGKPWDLMAWSFAGKFGEGPHSTKTPVQLQQEAAVVLSVGGGFQAYFKQKQDASIFDWTMKLMAETADFCRARRKFCHKAQPVPQVALLYSGKAHYRQISRPFSTAGLDGLRGTLMSLLDAQYSVEVLVEHQLSGRMADYPLIVVPEWEYLESAFRAELRAYVRGGGRLLLIGPAPAAMFRKELKARLVGRPEPCGQYIEQDGWLFALRTTAQVARLGRGAREFGKQYPANEIADALGPAASIAKCGNGYIAATYMNLGERYLHARTCGARDWLAALVRELMPRPIVEVRGSHQVDVQVNRVAGRLAVNLVNTSGPHGDRNVHVFDHVPPVGPLEIVLRPGRRPTRITRQPAGRKMRFTWSAGEARLTLPKLEIHEVIWVE
ncbi:MAG TPA: hypothetical protein DCX07_13030 [Phycisphaerales bacterium]|nr:hypothetical protein [Phycisphaerales bacterium]